MSLSGLRPCGLACAGGKDCQKINTINQLCHSFNPIIPRRVGPEVSKNFPHEFLPCLWGE